MTFFHIVHGSCCCHMFMVHVAFTCLLFMLNGLERFCNFSPRGFYSITAAEFMFGIWWPPMFTYFYHSLCVLLLYCFHSWFIYFMSWCLLICYFFSFLCSFIFISFHFFSFLFIFSLFSLFFLFFLLKKPLPT